MPRRASTKHFWLLRMVVRITSGGIARKASSNEPISTTGHSTSPATSASRPASSTSSNPCAKARFLASVRMMSRRRAGSSNDLGAVRASPRNRRAGAPERLRREEAMAACGRRPRRLPSTANGTISGSSVSGPKVATMECSGRTQLSAPGSPDARPSAWTSATGNCAPRRARSRRSPRSPARPRLLDHGDIEFALLGSFSIFASIDRFQSGTLEEARDRRCPARRRAGLCSPRAHPVGGPAGPAPPARAGAASRRPWRPHRRGRPPPACR